MVDPPEQAVALRMRLHDGLRRLSPRQRSMVVLRYYSGLSDTEIAHQLGVPLGSVKSALSRALVSMRAFMEEEQALQRG
jgi:RNA polymerase sigma factor (sigma-70 family)